VLNIGVTDAGNTTSAVRIVDKANPHRAESRLIEF
jgi:hypothetical protein